MSKLHETAVAPRGARFQKFSSDWACWYIYWTTFRKDFKNVNFIKLGPCSSTRKLCLACLLNFADQASWAEFARRGDLSDQKTKKGTFIRVEKLSFWESAVKIRDVVGTPSHGATNATTACNLLDEFERQKNYQSFLFRSKKYFAFSLYHHAMVFSTPTYFYESFNN